jgi:Putative transposase
MGQVPCIVNRTLATHQIRKVGYTHRITRTGAVTLIQRFCSALNLNIHFHTLLLDGVYAGGCDPRGKMRFQRVKAPDRAELEHLVYTIGLHGPAGGAGAAAASESDPLPRGVCTFMPWVEQPTPGPGDAEGIPGTVYLYYLTSVYASCNEQIVIAENVPVAIHIREKVNALAQITASGCADSAASGKKTE